MIQIHPKRAFLNTNVTINNKGEEAAVIEDSLSHDSYDIMPGECLSKRFKAGKHEFTIKWRSGDIEKQSIVVEDALKFGGSQRKNTYVFDSNPWAIVVMKDRTYFFNENTHEQFVEHNFCPDNIEELTPEYLLFRSKYEYSIFSLATMEFEETFHSTPCIFHGFEHCVFKSTDGLCLYRLNPRFKEERIVSIKCSNHIINEVKGIIYTFDKDKPNEISEIKLRSSSDRFEQIDTIQLDGTFVNFISSNYLLYTKSDLEDGKPNMLYSLDLSHKESQLINKELTPIFKVNNISLSQSDSYENFCNKCFKNEILSGVAYRICIDIVENSGKFIYIKNTESFSYKNHTIKKRLYSCLFYDSKLLQFIESDTFSFTHNGIYDYVECHNYTYLFYNSTYRKITDKVYFTKYGDPYMEFISAGKQEAQRYTIIDNYKILYGDEKSVPSSGIYHRTIDNQSIIYWLKTNKGYPGDKVETYPDAIKISGGDNIPPRYIMKNGAIVPVPATEKDMIAHSKTRKTILLEKGGTYTFAHYKDGHWAFSEDIVLTIYDNIHVNNAVFCSDGNSFIYQNGSTMVLFDCETEKETVFESNTNILYNVNGYRPYCQMDYYSRPVMIDPLSHHTVDHNFLNQYRFANNDGSVYFHDRYVKRTFRQDNSIVTPAQYKSLCEKYDLTYYTDKKTTEQIRKRREEYLNRINNSPIYIEELTMPSFVDRHIVKHDEYLVFFRNGERIEVKIGTPLWYLNYVAFSTDSKKAVISGKYRDNSGICLIYDFDKKEFTHNSIKDTGGSLAIWVGVCSKKGDIAYYDSCPTTFFLREGQKAIKIHGRSFLAFSPSGNLMALSRQGYTPYSNEYDFWGHEPSCDIFIVHTNDPQKCLCHFNDHGSDIVGTSSGFKTIASTSFSADEKRILSVSEDGVVVVRNLHLDEVK